MRYRSSKFINVLTGALAMAGIPTEDTAARLQALGFLNTRLREGVEYDYWPELTPAEERAYRDTWDAATTYDAGAEIYFVTAAGARAYYAANLSPNNPAAGESPESAPTKWTAVTLSRRYVALDQTGQTPIGEVEGLYDRDPYANPRSARRIRFKATSDGIVPLNWDCDTVWVRFRIRPPAFTLDEFDVAATYAAGETCFLETTGECYRALQATTGNGPTALLYWEKILFPYILETFVKRSVFADLLPADGENNKAGAELRKAFDALTQAHDAAFAGQGQYTTAAVQTY